MADRTPLPLIPYSAPPQPDRITLGLQFLRCPSCGSIHQRMMRAQQFWRDQSDYFCAQIHVEIDMCCQACDQGWRLHMFNEDEGEGEVMIEVTLVETVASEDANAMGHP
jgi:hypothetical protein